MDRKALLQYLCALLLFGLNGIVASHIDMSSYEIVFLRTLIGSVLLVVLFLFGKGKFHMQKNKRDIRTYRFERRDEAWHFGRCWMIM